MINWNKYFDHIYIITSCQNIDRQQKMDQKLKKLGITNYQYWWVPNYDFNNSLIFKETDLLLGHTRTTFGHYSLWKVCYERQLKNVLILEDDLCFLKDVNTIKEMLELYYSKRDKTDIYLFDYINYSSIDINNDNYKNTLQLYYLCSCYTLINNKSFEYLINTHEKNYLVCDNYFIDFKDFNNYYQHLFYTHKFNDTLSKNVTIDKFIKLDISPIRLGIQSDKIYTDIKDKNIYDII